MLSDTIIGHNAGIHGCLQYFSSILENYRSLGHGVVYRLHTWINT